MWQRLIQLLLFVSDTIRHQKANQLERIFSCVVVHGLNAIHNAIDDVYRFWGDYSDAKVLLSMIIFEFLF